MAKTENVELTVLCLIQDGDKILLQNRVKKDWKGYTLPGGLRISSLLYTIDNTTGPAEGSVSDDEPSPVISGNLIDLNIILNYTIFFGNLLPRTR